jgi:hypothetical protein
MRKLPAVVLALALVLPVAACSSDSEGSSTTTRPASSTSTTDAGGGGSTSSTSTTGGSGEPSGDADAYAASLAKGLTQVESSGAELRVSAEEADCVAPRWIEVIGLDRLGDRGVAPADLEDPDFDFPGLGLSDDDGLGMVDAFTDCGVDLYQQFTDVLAEGLDATQKACLERELTDDLARTFLSQTLTSSDMSADLSKTLDAIDQACELSPTGSAPG